MREPWVGLFGRCKGRRFGLVGTLPRGFFGEGDGAVSCCWPLGVGRWEGVGPSECEVRDNENCHRRSVGLRQTCNRGRVLVGCGIIIFTHAAILRYFIAMTIDAYQSREEIDSACRDLVLDRPATLSGPKMLPAAFNFNGAV